MFFSVTDGFMSCLIALDSESIDIPLHIAARAPSIAVFTIGTPSMSHARPEASMLTTFTPFSVLEKMLVN